MHHTYGWGNPYAGDFGIDEGNVAVGGAVRLFAAPQDTRLDNAITARVESTGLACAPRRGESYGQTRARGGDYVRVGVYNGGARSGTVTFVHVSATVGGGQPISRWGGQVGTVGQWTANSCWTGVHLHVELYNDTNYACYNRGFRPGQAVRATNFIGYLGGSFASGPRQACP